MLKKRMNSHKQLCLKQNCCGAKNDHQNFLSATNRHIHSTSRMKKSDVKKTISKKKSKPQNNNKQTLEVNKILQQSYNQLKQQNSKLLKKLSSKKNKIQQLEYKIKQYEISTQKNLLQIDHFQSLLKSYEQKKLAQQSNQKNNKGQKYQSIIQAQQALTKQTLDKYKNLQKQYDKYRELTQKKKQSYELKIKEYQKKVSRLEKQNVSIENKLSLEKKYQYQVQDIKKEFTNFKDKHNRSLRQNTQITINSLQSQITQLRQKNHLLEEQLLCISSKLKQNQLTFEHRQQQLLSNLDKISQKVSKFEQQTKNLNSRQSSQSNQWKVRYEELIQKYQRKKEKYFTKNQEWAQIFKQLMIQIERLKKQIAYISQRNVKLVQLYVQGQTKDN